MRLLLLLGVLLLVCLTPVSAQGPEVNPQRLGNFIERATLPAAQQDEATKDVVAMLAAGAVKTAATAEFWAFPSRASALRGDELPYVTGLFYIEVFARGEAPSRELVWEVRVVGGREDTRRLLWISVLTGAVTQLYPTR
jgi:hypothetical protein